MTFEELLAILIHEARSPEIARDEPRSPETTRDEPR